MRNLLTGSLIILALVAGSLQLLGPATAQDAVATKVDTALQDGPYLFHEAGGGVTAKWVHDGRVETKHFAERWTIETQAPDPAVWEQPEKVLALSDVEGQYDDFLRFLKGNGVVDGDGRWSFGAGHLVCIGDMVDRGTKVTETLWLLLRLSREAKAAGGHVHHVLGNHEAMLMGGDVRYTAPKYKAVAALMGTSCEGLVGADTELGCWMRTRNSVVRLGDYVFVHAGIAPIVAAAKTDLEVVNTRVRAALGVPPQAIKDKATLGRVWGRESVLWYRGYFPQHARDFGPTPTRLGIERILENVGGKTIVVGHTKVRAVTPLFGGRVLAIDVPWTRPQNVRGLLIGKDRVDVVDIAGERTELTLPEHK